MIGALAWMLMHPQAAPTFTAKPLPLAEESVNERLPVVPTPKRLGFLTRRLEIGGKVEFPAGQFMDAEEFRETLSKRFDLSSASGPVVMLDGGISDLKLPKQAFTIRVDTTGVHVFGQDEEGLQLGLRRLAILAFSDQGHLYLPMGSITDWPSTDWRGFHLFVGPHARSFQTNLASKVFLPLGFNKAVLQCEQTAWETLPKLRGGIVMPREELKALFKWYRANGVEAIPLVQSFGHMEWFFRNGANLDLAINPKDPFTIDPRKPQSGEILNRLWSEVIDVTKAKNVHFGCDEVDLRGMPKDADLVTSLWNIQIPLLSEIAKKNQVGMIIWGDQLLSEHDAVDAGQAETPEAAKARRDALPAGVQVADWHYQNTSDYSRFFQSLDLFERMGVKPIATSWFQPENARSFAIAAVQRRCGILESTWAGYESSELNPFENFDQFAAFILTAEYAWSGRQDDITDLGYDYRDLFRRMWFQAPIRLAPGAGFAITYRTDAEEVRVGRYHFIRLDPKQALTSQIIRIPSKVKGSKLAVLMEAEGVDKVGTTVATLRIKLANGTTMETPLVYGWQIRAKSDAENAKDPDYCPGAEYSNGAFAVRVPVRGQVVSVELAPNHSPTSVKVIALDVLE